MPITFPSTKKRRLGELLMDAGLVSEQQLRVALTEQRKWGGRLGHTLVQLGFVDEQAMVAALSRQLHLPVVDLDSADLGTVMAQYLRYEIAERYAVCPLSADPKKRLIQVATSDPTNADAVQALTFQTGMKVELVVASAGSIERGIRRVYGRERRVPLAPAPNPTAMAEKLEALAARVADLETKLQEQRQIILKLTSVSVPSEAAEPERSTAEPQEGAH